MRAAICLIPLVSGLLLGQTNRFDILIAGAKVIDGSGSPWFYADIGIRGDTIAAVGSSRTPPPRCASMRAGWSSRPDSSTSTRTAAAASSSVPPPRTTCAKASPRSSKAPTAVRRCPSRRSSTASRKTPISINFATFVGQGTIREQVIGLANRKATPEEIEKMKALAAQAMRDGAFGLSTGLFYVPGNFTPTEEVIEIAKVVGAHGRHPHLAHARRGGARAR